MELNNIIHSECWHNLCDYQYTGQSDLPEGIIDCDIGAIPEFFKHIDGNKKRYIVISSCSDFFLCYQRQFPPWADLWKAVRMFTSPKVGYSGIKLESRCSDRCNPKDLYSIKSYSWTEATFDKIPDEVFHWFCTNNCISHPKVTSIPFGMAGTGGASDCPQKIVEHPKNLKREKLLYVNFQFYTNERADLFKYFKSISKYRKDITVEREKPFEYYLDQLNRHKYCLCPIGNGIDCYRTWEALYMGCVPILEYHPGIAFLDKTSLPHIFYSNLIGIGINELDYIYPLTEWNWNLEEAKLSFWKVIIDEMSKM